MMWARGIVWYLAGVPRESTLVPHTCERSTVLDNVAYIPTFSYPRQGVDHGIYGICRRRYPAVKRDRVFWKGSI